MEATAAAVVSKEDADYFGYLSELRRKEVERQTTLSYEEYMPPELAEKMKGIKHVNPNQGNTGS